MIAILGWGSLINNPGKLSLKGAFKPGGPRLPLEFSHVARDGRLTLIIDEQNGTMNPTQYAISDCFSLKGARLELQEREGVDIQDRIGWIDLTNWTYNKRCIRSFPKSTFAIAGWANDLRLDGVIWTASWPNFKDKTGEFFSMGSLARYVAKQKSSVQDLCREYLYVVPQNVSTPGRKVIYGYTDLDYKD